MKKQLQQLLVCILSVLLLASLPASLAENRYETLKAGDENPLVHILQTCLRELGFDLKLDGKFGLGTQDAVKAFQRQNKLTADGLAGHQTISLLLTLVPQHQAAYDSIVAQPSKPVASPPSTVPVSSSQLETLGEPLYTATVSTGNSGALNIRSQATWGLNVIAKAQPGSLVSVLAVSGAWSLVAYDGQQGWVVSSYLQQGGTANPAATTAPAQTPATSPPQNASPGNLPISPSGTNAWVTTPDQKSLNLRDKAGFSGKTILGIPHGANVDVLGQHRQWTQVSYQGKTGFVVDSFLHYGSAAPSASPTASPAPVATSVPSQLAIGQAVVNTAKGRFLNLRSAPTGGTNIIGQLASGTRLTLLSRGNDWSQVSHEGKAGYVMTSFLQFEQALPVATTPPAVSQSPQQTPLPPVTLQPTPVANSTPQPIPLTPPVETPQPSPPEDQLFPRTLSQGMSGQDVKELQNRLTALKYDAPQNSEYDQQTKNAVASFQAKNGLTADGIFGSQSAKLLTSSAARAADSAPLSYTTLRIDNRNGSVSALQKALLDLGFTLAVNGRFDIPTHEAVVGFQQRNGLPITGVANATTQAALFSGTAKGFDTPVSQLPQGEGKGEGPSTSQVQLLHWFNEVKKSAASGQQVQVYHPASDISFTIRFYSMGNHADSEPATFRDTQLMNRAFGAPSWNINTVYVRLQDGRWTLAAMHNRPHLTGSVSDNGFGGHLCIHFLRDTEEVNRNDPDYGASNQRAIRKAWQALRGETIP